MKSTSHRIGERLLLALAWPFGRIFWFFVSRAYHLETKRLRREKFDE
jgi:hypothetical protein